MLKKLLKQEYKATGRFFLPAYAIFAALLVIERLSMLAATNLAKAGDLAGQIAEIFVGLFTAVTVLGLIVMILSPFIYATVRFYRNMLGDEGYLMHTLPVTASQHLWAKLLTAGSWEVITILVMAAYGSLFFLTVDPAQTAAFFQGLGDLFAQGFQALGAWMLLLILLTLAALLLQMGHNLLSLYSAMSIGQTAAKHKLLSSAAAYLGIQFATATLLQLLGLSMVLSAGQWWIHFMEDGLPTSSLICRYVCILLLAVCLINALLAALHFFLSRHMLTKKLNLA